MVELGMDIFWNCPLLVYKGHVRSSSAGLPTMPVEQALSRKSRGGGTP